MAADPLSPVNRENLANLLFLAGRFDEATAESARASEVDPSRPDGIAAFVLIFNRRFDVALRLAQAWPEGADRTQCLALVLHGLGRKVEADAQLEELIAAYGADEPFRVAEVYAYRGENDEAFRWLQATSRLQPLRRPPVTHFSPFLKPLHSDARWSAWVASLH